MRKVQTSAGDEWYKEFCLTLSGEIEQSRFNAVVVWQGETGAPVIADIDHCRSIMLDVLNQKSEDN